MTIIKIALTNGNQFMFESKGHCSHDVCVGISALANTLVQYAEDYGREHEQVTTYTKLYESGNVLLEAELPTNDFYAQFVSETKALMLGFELYEANYPNDIKIIWDR